MTIMTRWRHAIFSRLPVLTIVGQDDQPLLSPVLQHLPYGIVGYVGTLHGNRLLHGLFCGKLPVQTFVD